MEKDKDKEKDKEKAKGLHPRNNHSQDYDFDVLIKAHPKLASFVIKNPYDVHSIDFSDANAVLSLNQSLMAHFYKVKDWAIPKDHLCPPIPSRANYIHYIADLLTQPQEKSPPVGTKVKGLDIGTGTGCIYPILGNSIYGWKFIGSDISSDALNHANLILKSNPALKKNIKVRFQNSAKDIFKGLIKKDEYFDFTMCNPPFYSSLDEANQASSRKVKNLNRNKEKKGHSLINESRASNFGGLNAELWCAGGEAAFIKKMITQSIAVKNQCGLFTTLVSNKENLIGFYQQLKRHNITNIRTTQMQQGNKISHLLAWKF